VKDVYTFRAFHHAVLLLTGFSLVPALARITSDLFRRDFSQDGYDIANLISPF
jgi:hypothetical protein